MPLRGFILSVVFLSVVAAALGAEGVFPYRCQRHTLPNGLTVLMIPMPSAGVISYFTVVRTGSRDEVEPGRSGYAHLFEHMMFRGTKKHPGSEYDRIVAQLGARANAFTSDDLTAYHLTFCKEDLETVIDMESDRFRNLRYDEATFQTEAGAVYGEYCIARSHPEFAVDQKLQELAYDVHTYKHTTMGFEADIRAMPTGYKYSRSFHQRFYRPENTVLLVVGDFDPAATLALIDKYYGAWAPGYEPPEIAPEPPQTVAREANVAFPGRTLPILTIAYKGAAFDPDDRDYAAARLLGDLAFGPQSELHKKLVLREHRVESLGCDVPVNRDQPLFTITARVKKADDIEAVREEIYRALREFQTSMVDPQKLDDMKRRERYEFLMDLDSPEKVAARMTRFIAATGDVECVDRLYATLEKISPEDIRRAARKFFTPERRTVVVLRGTEAENSGTAKKKTPETHEKSEPPAPDKRPPVGFKPAAQTTANRQDRSAANAPVLLPVPADPTITFRLWFRAGSQNDPPGKEGLAAITAAMLAEGATRSNSYEKILDKLAPLAADYAASTTVEMTVISGRFHRDNLARFYPLFIEAVREPAFRQADLDRIKARTLNYLENTLRYSSDEELGKAVLYDAVFADTPYGHLPEGTVRSVRGITLDDVRRFYDEYYTRDNVVIGLGGGYDAALLEKLQNDLAGLPPGRPQLPPAIRPRPLHGRHVTIVEKDCGATAISLGFPMDTGALRGTKDWYALAIANSWLGQHRNQNGHLYQVIREARGLNYGDYTYIEHFPRAAAALVPPTNVSRRCQIFEMWLRPVPNAARQFALRAALREFQKLVDNGMTEKEFKETQKFLRKFVLHLAPTTSERLGYALDDRFYGISGPHLENFRRAMDELTVADVNAAIRRHWQYENLDIVFVTPNAAALKEALADDSPSPIAYATPKPAAVLAEDREIGAFPLKIRREDVQIVPVSEIFQR